MSNDLKKQLENIEKEREKNKKKLRKAESKSEDIYYNIQEERNVLSLIFEGYQGDTANTFYWDKEEVIKNAFRKNTQFLDLEKANYEKINKSLYEQEDEIMGKQWKKCLEGKENDN